jgi:hypothetical protein
MTTRLARLLLGGFVLSMLSGCGTTTPSGPAIVTPSAPSGPSATPGASTTTDASPAPTAEPSPSVAPVVTPGPDGSLAVDLIFHDDPAGRSVRLLVTDASGWLIEARDATAAELLLPPVGSGRAEPSVARIPGDPSAIVVSWVGWICDTTARLGIDEGLTTITVTAGPVETCDAMGVGRGVTLGFRGPVDASAVAARLEEGATVEVIPRREVEAAAVALVGGHEWEATRALLAAGGDFDPRLQPPDRLVWAVSLANQALPGSCPSLGPGGDPFTADPCVAATAATIFLDARTGAYLGVVYTTL